MGDTSVSVSQDKEPDIRGGFKHNVEVSVSVSQDKEPDIRGGFKHNVEGELVRAVEEKIIKCVEAGAKNKMSYEIKVIHAVDQVMKACEETRFNLVVMTTSHLDSWLRSLLVKLEK